MSLLRALKAAASAKGLEELAHWLEQRQGAVAKGCDAYEDHRSDQGDENRILGAGCAPI